MRLKSRTASFSFMLAPYWLLFTVFIAIPVLMAVALSFTYFNTIQPPSFNGMKNYIYLITQDTVFMQNVLPNTILYALIVGPGGYALSFVLAWALAQISHKPRTVLTLILYSPSMTSGVVMAVIWKILFSGDSSGYLNSLMLRLKLTDAPIQWLQSPKYLMGIMIFVTLWSSMGVGFLAMLAGILNIDSQIYEAAYIDGIKNRFQEIMYITIPSMKPQMLFGGVMAIVGTFSSGGIGVALSGANPTPQYSGQLIVNHIEDYGFIRYEMGYAAAVSVVLLLMIALFNVGVKKLFVEKD